MYQPLSVPESLYAQAVGEQVLLYIKRQEPAALAQLALDRAVSLLARIKAALDDPSLDDPDCFQKIEALVTAFSDAGLPTQRHDW